MNARNQASKSYRETGKHNLQSLLNSWLNYLTSEKAKLQDNQKSAQKAINSLSTGQSGQWDQDPEFRRIFAHYTRSRLTSQPNTNSRAYTGDKNGQRSS